MMLNLKSTSKLNLINQLYESNNEAKNLFTNYPIVSYKTIKNNDEFMKAIL